MADVTALQGTFTRMIRDVPRDRLPGDACWNLVDYLPGLDAPLTKRGGWTYASNDISASSASAASATQVLAGAYAPFATGAKNCAIDEDGNLYTIAANGTVTFIGLSNAGWVPEGPLSFHREKLIIPRSDGAAGPNYYDGSTLGTLAGSPPSGKYTAVYKDRTVLARSAALPNRVYFSGAGDPTSWDTTNSWVDASFPVTGLASLRNALLVLSNQRIERITGSTPPPGSDMSLQTLFEPGCLDARSVTILEDKVLFANQTGVYVTDGATIADLTEAGGMKSYWITLMSAYASGWQIACGTVRRHFLIGVVNGATFKDAFLVDPSGRSWVRLSNLKTYMFWETVGTAAETYCGSRATDRVLSMSSMWSPAAGVKNDADGTAVAPVWESAFFKPTIGKQAWKRLYVDYDVRDAATDNPLLTASYITSPELTSYTNVTKLDGTTADTFAETTAYTTARRFLNVTAEGLGFKVSQTNASATTKLYGIGAEVRPREASRL